ncbi:MAG: hypothetical protein ACYS76_00320 [Planctomycetota bacterium]|jgi:hypothetical protein
MLTSTKALSAKDLCAVQKEHITPNIPVLLLGSGEIFLKTGKNFRPAPAAG